VTVRTFTLLLSPKMNQPSLSSEIVLHDQTKSALEVFLPGRIERIGFTFDFDMTADLGVSRLHERDPFLVAITMDCRPNAEDPVFPSNLMKVAILHPSEGFIGMSSACPAPKHFPDEMIYLAESIIRHLIAVIVPSP
jgi:hypothetical protein